MTKIITSNELWREIPGFENCIVSNRGNVRYRDTSLHQIKTKKGYLAINHFHKRIFVHRLVAYAWVPNHENKPYINHKDGNKENNVPDNLEWVSTRENTLHAWYILDKNNHKPKRPVLIYKAGILVAETPSVALAAKFVNGGSSSVSKCCQGRKTKHNGYTFRYKVA